MACNCTNSPCGCLQIPRGERGFQGPPGPAPTLEVGTVEALPAGDTPIVTLDPVAGGYSINLSLPAGATGATGAAGANGADATELFTTLSSFQVGLLNTTTIATVGDTSWMVDGGWLYIENAGYFYISNVLSPTTVQLVNPGSVLGWPTGIPGQAAPLTVVPITGPNQVIQAAVPGLPGTDGAAGPTGPQGPAPDVGLTVGPLVGPPAPGEEFQFTVDDLANPTELRANWWDGLMWVTTGNLIIPGARIFPVAGDPNSVTVGGSAVGDVAFNTTTPGWYQKTSNSPAPQGTWILLAAMTNTFQQVATQSAGDMGTTPLTNNRVIGYTPDTQSVINPGDVMTVDLQYKVTEISTDKNFELDWDDTNFPTAYGQYEVHVENLDASPISVTFTAARWSALAGLALTSPYAVAGSATAVIQFSKTAAGMVITAIDDIAAVV